MQPARAFFPEPEPEVTIVLKRTYLQRKYKLNIKPYLIITGSIIGIMLLNAAIELL